MGFVQFKGAEGNGTSMSVTMSAAPTNGNLLVAFATSAIGGETIGTGWTNIIIQGEGTLDGCWAYKVAGASEPTTQTPYTQSSGLFTVGVWEFSSVSSTNDGFVVTENVSSTPPTVTLTATPGSSGDYALVGAAFNGNSTGSPTITQGGISITIDGQNLTGNSAVWGHLNSAPSGSQSYVATFGTGTNKCTGGLLFLKATSTGSTGTLSETLGAATLSSTAKVIASASESSTLGAAGVSSSGTVQVTASATDTLGAATVSSSGQVKVSAGAAIALGPATLASTAQVTDSASLGITLGSASLSGAAHVIDTASLGISVGAVQFTASGTTTNVASGSLSEVLGSLSLTSTAESIGTAALSEAFGAMQCLAQAYVIDTASFDVGLDAATLQAAGGMVVAGPQIIVPLNLQPSWNLPMPLFGSVSIPLSLESTVIIPFYLE